MKKVKFDVQGMTCSSCSAHVEKAVRKLNGIKDVNVNLLSNSMIVEYDENKVDNNKIIASVIEAGYNSNVSEGVEKTEQAKTNKLNNVQNNIKTMKKQLIISVCFLIPLMYIAMYHMLYEWFGIPIPQAINLMFHGFENAISFAFSQLLLLIPIIYVNRNYFIIGFKRLFKGKPNMDTLIAIRK